MTSDQDRNEPRLETTLSPPVVDVYDRTELVRPAPRRGRWFAAAFAFVALGAFAGVAWYATSTGRDNPTATVPVITAENAPVKERPAEPGGMEVPNRDIQVFNRISPDGQPQRVERLLPPPAETPVARPPAAAEARPPSGPLVPNAPAIAPRGEAPAFSGSPAAGPAAAPQAERTVSAVPVTPPKVAEKTGQVAALPKPSGTRAWRIQLGAARDEARAKSEVARMRKAHGDLVKGLEAEIQRADLGAKGVFWRLRMGPLIDRAAAEELCRKLAARKVGCIVVKP